MCTPVIASPAYIRLLFFAGVAAPATALLATAPLTATAPHNALRGVVCCTAEGCWLVSHESAWARGHARHPESHECCVDTGACLLFCLSLVVTHYLSIPCVQCTCAACSLTPKSYSCLCLQCLQAERMDAKCITWQEANMKMEIANMIFDDIIDDTARCLCAVST